MKKYAILALVLILTLSTTLHVSAANPPFPGGPYSSAFRVQNLDTGSVTCQYIFYDAAGTAAYTSATSAPIAPGDALFVYAPNITGLASGTYSGVVNCTGKVAAVANFASTLSAASFNGITTAATTWFAPAVYNNYYNYYSSLIVQNATDAPVNITVDIFAAGNPVAVKTQTATAVPAFASADFAQEGVTELASNTPYSARITATGNVAPVVTIYGKAAYANQLFSYNAFQTGATTMYAPVLMKNYYGYNSALVIQNLGSVATHVSVSYTAAGGPYTQEQDVAAGSPWSIYVPTQGPASVPSGNINGIFSAIVTSTGTGGNAAQNIAVVINESNSYNRAASFDGFSAGSTTVMAPVLEKRYYNYNSSMTCQVISGGPATMTIEYFGTSGSLGTITSPSLANGQTNLFYQPNASMLSNNWVGSAKVTSTANIACVVNQDMNEGTYATTMMDQLLAYEGIAPAP